MNPRKRIKQTSRCRKLEIPFRYGKAKQDWLRGELKGQNLITKITFQHGKAVFTIRKTGGQRSSAKVDQLISRAIEAVTAMVLPTASKAA